MFHMYVGVRAGGGIGDEIEDPAGDEFEVERIFFDITFFFFVIVILLAIIQGESQRLNLFYTICFYQETLKRILFTLFDKNTFHEFFMWKWRKNKVSVYSAESSSFTDICQSHESLWTNRYTDAHSSDPFFAGLIIDAFGELRDQQEQVKEDMEVRFETRTH